MSTNNEPDVKIIDKVEVAPAGDDEETVESPDSSQEDETEEGADETREETEEAPESEDEKDEEEPAAGDSEADESEPEPHKAAPQTNQDEKYGNIKRREGETPAEFALRLENARLRGKLRDERRGEIMTPAPAPAKKELPPEKKAILAKFKQEELATFREALDVMADEMGFVRKDQLDATNYQEKAGEVLDGFLEKHPEYLPANDPDSVLWNAFKAEYALYKPTQNPRELARILERVHKEVYGIRPAAALDKKDAAKKNVQVASHSGASRPNPKREGVRRAASPAPAGLNRDMLKGFSDEELDELGL